MLRETRIVLYDSPACNTLLLQPYTGKPLEPFSVNTYVLSSSTFAQGSDVVLLQLFDTGNLFAYLDEINLVLSVKLTRPKPILTVPQIVINSLNLIITDNV